jgi:hypothetical protein
MGEQEEKHRETNTEQKPTWSEYLSFSTQESGLNVLHKIK